MGRASGFSLIEMMISVAVMSIISLAMAGYISNISSQQRILMQKAEAVSIDTNLTNLFTTTTTHCTGNLAAAGIHFQSGHPPAGAVNIACPTCTVTTLNYYKSDGTVLAPDIITGQQADGSGLDISNVQLKNIIGPAGGPYTADVVINYGGPPPAPPSFEVKGIALSATTSGGNDTLNSCAQASTCDANFTLVSSGTTGDQLCISTNARPATQFSGAVAGCASGTTFAHLCSPAEWTEACAWDPGGGSTYIQGPQTNAATCQCTHMTQGHWHAFPPPGYFVPPTCTSWADPNTGNPCVPTYQSILTGAHDNGPKLHMGSPAEWVNQEHLYDNGNGGQWNGTIMGGPGPNMNGAGTCTGWSQYQTYATNSYPYRCCYRP